MSARYAPHLDSPAPPLSSVMVSEWASTPHATFAEAHWSDLVSGEPLKLIAKEFAKVVAHSWSTDKTIRWKMTQRVYGGGNWRVCMPFRCCNRVLHNDYVDRVLMSS